MLKKLTLLILPIYLLFGEELYVLNNGDNTVTVISIPDNTFIKNFPLSTPIDSDLFGITIAPNNQIAYITSNNDTDSTGDQLTTLQLYDTNIVTDISNGIGLNLPYFSAISPNGQFLWIPNYDNNTISIINTSDNSLAYLIGEGLLLNEPWSCAITPDGAYAWIVNYPTTNISIISTLDNSLVTNFDAGSESNLGIAFSPDGAHAWLTNNQNGRIYIIRTSDGFTLNSINPDSALDSPAGIAFSSSGDYVYVANQGNNSILVIDANNYELVTTIPSNGFLSNPTGIAINDSLFQSTFKHPSNHRQ